MWKKPIKRFGFKYSRESFEEYKYRAKVEIIKDGETHNFDIYTDNTNKNITFTHLLSFINAKVLHIKIINWSSKENDDADSKLIDETMDYWERRKQVDQSAQMDNQSPLDYGENQSY